MVALKDRVLVVAVEEAVGCDVGEPLDLVDDGRGVRHSDRIHFLLIRVQNYLKTFTFSLFTYPFHSKKALCLHQ